MTSLRKTLIAACIALSTPSMADVNKDLTRFFDDLDYATNTTRGSAYKSQSANHYTGGSAYIRTPITETQLMSFTPPSINAGCGGIDLFSGGFSHVNSDELVKMGKNIIAAAPAFAVELALQTWAPQIKSIKDRLEQIARAINALSINSCEAAQIGVSALAGFADIGNKDYICATMATKDNTFADWAAAKNGCSDEATADNKLDSATKDDALKDIITANRNIIWYSILGNEFLSHDLELAEFFMSLSGTIIYDKKMKAHRKSSLLTGDNNLIKILLEGGKAKMYRCDDRKRERCLAPVLREITFDSKNMFKTKIIKILDEIAAKYKADSPLNEEQQAFLESVSLPVLKMMSTTLNAAEKVQAPAYASVIASDLITDYLMQSLALIKASITRDGNDVKDLDDLYAAITEANSALKTSRLEALQTLAMEQTLVQSMMEIEKRIEGNFSSQTRANLLFDDTK